MNSDTEDFTERYSENKLHVFYASETTTKVPETQLYVYYSNKLDRMV